LKAPGFIPFANQALKWLPAVMVPPVLFDLRTLKYVR
jgi:hypothetical protein